MKNKLCLLSFCILLLPAIAFSQTTPQILCRSGNSELTVDGFDDVRPFHTEAGKNQYFSPKGVFHLQGDIDTLIDYAWFTPLFIRSQKPDTKSANSTVETTQVAYGINDQNSWTHEINDLLEYWNLPKDQQHILAVAWIDLNTSKHRIKFNKYHPQTKKNKKAYSKKRVSHTSDQRLYPAFFFIDSKGKLIAPPAKTDTSAKKQLTLAALEDDSNTFSKLLKENESLKNEDFLYFEPLHMCSAWGSMNCMEVLLTNGIKIDEKSKLKQQPIHLAVSNFEKDTVQFLISHEANLSTGDKEGDTPLHHAVMRADDETAFQLVEAGAKTNKENKRGKSPAAIAVDKGNLKLFRFLHEKGSKIHLSSYNKIIMAMKAVRKNDIESLKYIVEKWPKTFKSKSGIDWFSAACRLGNAEVIQFLIDNGVDPNKPDSRGITPLAYAATKNIDAVRVLLHAGVDPNTVSSGGATALHHSIMENQLEITKFLLDNGADPNLKNPDGTPIMWFATLMGNRKGLHSLIEAGAKCAMSTDTAIPIMEHAFRYDIPEIVEITLSQCLSPDFKFYEDIPSYWVADYYNSTAIKQLLENNGIAPTQVEQPKFTNAKLVRDQIKIVESVEIPYPYSLQDKYGEFTLKVQLIIDKNGDVILPNTINNPAPEMRRTILDTLQKWKFAPITLNDEPVRCRVRLPIKFNPVPEKERVFEITKTELKPQPNRIVEPTYPHSLMKKRINGQVTLVFIVDEEGNVLAPRVESATHQAFIEPALKAISRWKFVPGYIGGEKVKVRVRAPLMFRVG